MGNQRSKEKNRNLTIKKTWVQHIEDGTDNLGVEIFLEAEIFWILGH